MNTDAIVHSMLAASQPISDVVGDRFAMGQLPQGTLYPALVYHIVTAVPVSEVSYQRRSQRISARVQFSPLAVEWEDVVAIHAALRSTFDFIHATTVGSNFVVSSRFELLTQPARDDEFGIWTQPADYLLVYYE